MLYDCTLMEIKKKKDKYAKYKNYCKVRDHCEYRCGYAGGYRGAAYSIISLKYCLSKEIVIVIHNESKYDYHFIIKELAEESEGQFTFLGEKNEK